MTARYLPLLVLSEASTSSKSAQQLVMALMLLKRVTQHLVPPMLTTFTTSSIPVLIVSTLYLYVTGSLFFDIVHYTLHQLSKSRSKLLRCIGYIHEVHHLYFNRRLKFNNRYLWQNMFCELPLELSCQLFGTWLGYLALPGLVSQELLNLMMVFEVLRSFVVAILQGRDSNHQTYETVMPKDPHSFLVGPEYHAMHHVDPSAYVSSSFRVFDWIFGTSYTLRSRRIMMSGLEGGFGQAIKKELELRESVNCVQELNIFGEGQKMIEILTNTDILIIGNEECISAIETIELFKQHYKPRSGNCLLLPEVWYVSSETPDSSSSASFIPHARKYYDEERFIYKQIVLSNSTSGLWRALGSEWMAKVAMWWIRRGARFSPATNPASALREYLRFFYGT
jgi:sterol desaturase/sphingolipid hydroxylase (fatty acid hydroxylase superfamily)